MSDSAGNRSRDQPQTSENIRETAEPRHATRSSEIVSSRSLEARMGPSSQLGIAAIFEQLEGSVMACKCTEHGRPTYGGDADRLSLQDLNTNHPSLGPFQLQSSTIGFTQMLQLLGNSSSSLPTIPSGPAFAFKPSDAPQLPAPYPLDTGLTFQQKELAYKAAGDLECLLPESPFEAAAGEHKEAAAGVAACSAEAEGGPAPVPRAQRRARLQFHSRVKDDAEWELDEDDAEPDWKGLPSRNIKESKVNVSCSFPFIVP
jgi:hypothetical protein